VDFETPAKQFIESVFAKGKARWPKHPHVYVPWQEVRKEDGLFWNLDRTGYPFVEEAMEGTLTLSFPGDDGYMPIPGRNCAKRFILVVSFTFDDDCLVTIKRVASNSRAKARVSTWHDWLVKRAEEVAQ
jgi:hypothetical protein